MRAALRGALPEYEERPGQVKMAEAVANALAKEKTLFVEAGTGTGKTLAYLIPAVLSGKKVIISTATRALQEQIFDKDLPLVAALLADGGVVVRAAMMKGLSNYLCKRRWNELAASANGNRIDVDVNLSRIARWLKEESGPTEDGEIVMSRGDRAELSDLPEESLAWRDVQSSTETRIGAECKYYDECFVTRMKRDAEEAQIVVVNHHLFCADLALRRGRRGGAAVLPPYDAVIFDEAHRLEDIATNFFGTRVSTARVEMLARDARKSFVAEKIEGGLTLLEQAERMARDYFNALARATPPASTSSPPPSRFGAAQNQNRPMDRRPIAASDLEASAHEYNKLDAALDAVEHFAEASSKSESVNAVARRASEIRRDLRQIVKGVEKAYPADWDDADEDQDRQHHEPAAHVAWIDVRDRNVSIGASPIDVGPTLNEALFERVQAVVCTSATLATSDSGTDGEGSSFRFARERLGAPKNVDELVIPSPFDFENRAALYLPKDIPDPRDANFIEEASEKIRALVEITGGGAFVLCTSNRTMRAFASALRGRIDAPVLVQGTAPKHLLLSRFRAHGDSVLVATMSFWEGVDVPGRALRLVVMDKIPFAVPSDPVVAARSSRIEREGGNPFVDYSVPLAALTLKQGFGRLIRRHDDAGIVAILDKRAATRGYGRSLLRALPPARQVHSLDEVRAFWKQVHAIES
ncbi:MAG: ATP-dependent DNA helicase [Polyangiaceae bacterium]